MGGRRLLSIVLGTTSENARANESQKLLNWGYTAYDAVKLFEAGQAMEEALLWKGSQSSVKLGREAATVVTVPSGSSGQLSTRIERQDPLIAPIAKGQQIGTLHVQLGTETLGPTARFCLGRSARRWLLSPRLGCHSLVDSVIGSGFKFTGTCTKFFGLLYSRAFRNFPKGFTFALF